jgi:hypothetical protein
VTGASAAPADSAASAGSGRPAKPQTLLEAFQRTLLDAGSSFVVVGGLLMWWLAWRRAPRVAPQAMSRHELSRHDASRRTARAPTPLLIGMAAERGYPVERLTFNSVDA